ncbi:MAG: hypothetical protein M5R38_07155 [Candidatus Methylomirabilis sp.]|nr:hypothetical protein [Candidatus Methylomirabilis sp.]
MRTKDTPIGVDKPLAEPLPRFGDQLGYWSRVGLGVGDRGCARYQQQAQQPDDRRDLCPWGHAVILH